jgi:amino acid adenylation domain-containing protein
VWLHKQDLPEAEKFWRASLAGAGGTSVSSFGAGGVVQGKACTTPVVHEAWLEPGITAALLASAKEQRLTPATLLHAAWALLLSRYSGAGDVVFGSTIAGRPHTLPHAEFMVGLFIATVPVRVSIDPHVPVGAWLQQVQVTLASVREYGYCGLEQIQHWSNIPPGGSLFDSLVVFENYPVMPGQGGIAGEIAIDDVHSTESTHLPVTIVGGCADRFLVRVLRDPAFFDAATAERWLEEFGQVLTAFTYPLMKLGTVLSGLAVATRDSILRGNTAARQGRSIVDVIEGHAQASPDATAVETSGERLSYRALDLRANQLAWYLLSKGIGLEKTVGILIGSPVQRIVAVLAVLKTGGAYLPLDHRYPADRLQSIITTTGAALVLTDRAMSAEAVLPDVPVAVVDDMEPHIARMPDSAPARRCDPLSLAYTIFTSGSTGEPKGIQVHHEGLLNLACAFGERFSLSRESRQMQFFSFAFDGSVGDIFGVLAAGGTLIIPENAILGSVPDLQDFIEAHRVNVAMMTPTMLGVLDPSALGSLRTVVAGGELCQSATAERWMNGRAFHNAYGPTEITVAATEYAVQPGVLPTGSLPIGTPLPNMRSYILDERLDPVPRGVPGELYIAGAGVARGYCRRPELTAAVFVPDPFGESPGARMYRTGDRVRLLPDDNLLFIDRVDLQIKLRGYRIEPGEIEAVLCTHPAVGDAAVLCMRDNDTGEYLAAYVTARDGMLLDPGALRDVCARKLPPYMVPVRYLVLEKFPITAHGKIDRSALPEPEVAEDHSGAYVGPRTATERELVAIWEDILQRGQVGVQDNFFMLGGHSLLALRLLGEVEKKLGYSFPLLTFFQHPTIEVLASLIDCARPAAGGSLAVELKRGGADPPLVLVHPTGGSVHWYMDLVHELRTAGPVIGIQAAGLYDEEPPDGTIDEMVTRYSAAIRGIYPPGPIHVAGWSLGVIVAYALALRLVRHGYAMLMLGIMDQGPEPPMRHDPADAAELLGDIFGGPLGVDAAFLRTMSEDEQYLYVLRLARKRGLVPLTLRRKQFMRYLRLNMVEGHAWRTYTPEPYAGKITVFCSAEDAGTNVAGSGWATLATAGVDVIRVPGDHLTMMRQPHVKVLASRVDAAMNSAYEEWRKMACLLTPKL